MAKGQAAEAPLLLMVRKAIFLNTATQTTNKERPLDISSPDSPRACAPDNKNG